MVKCCNGGSPQYRSLFPNLHQAPTEEQQEIKDFVYCLVSAGAAAHAGGGKRKKYMAAKIVANIIYPLS